MLIIYIFDECVMDDDVIVYIVIHPFPSYCPNATLVLLFLSSCSKKYKHDDHLVTCGDVMIYFVYACMCLCYAYPFYIKKVPLSDSPARRPTRAHT